MVKLDGNSNRPVQTRSMTLQSSTIHPVNINNCDIARETSVTDIGHQSVILVNSENPSEHKQVTHDCQSSSNLQTGAPNIQSVPLINVATPSTAINQNNDINNTLIMLLQQNQMLVNRLLERDNLNTNVPKTNGYYIMPDFHGTLPTFSGNELVSTASEWLRTIESV